MSGNIVKIGAYGVKIGVEVADREQRQTILVRMEDTLPVGFKVLGIREKVDHQLKIKSAPKNRYELFKADEKIVGSANEELVLDRLDSQIRLTVAEFAVGNVFVHSGVVGWKDRAIMIPASSFKGKTTLVAELVKSGATYYSDEYAVLDKEGLVHPFPKTLSMREKNGGGQQTEYPVEHFGGKSGDKPLPVGLVLITEYQKHSRWKPEVLTRGQGVLEIISHTVPIRNDPGFSLSVLNKVVDSAAVVKSKRGSGSRFAKRLLAYFEESILKL